MVNLENPINHRIKCIYILIFFEWWRNWWDRDEEATAKGHHFVSRYKMLQVQTSTIQTGAGLKPAQIRIVPKNDRRVTDRNILEPK